MQEPSLPPAGSLATTFVVASSATATGGVLRSPTSSMSPGHGASVHGVQTVHIFDSGRCHQCLLHHSLLEAPHAPRLPLSVLLAAADSAGRLSMSIIPTGLFFIVWV